MTLYRETSYAYAVGRIRVAETRMLRRPDLERMIEARSVEDILRMLQDRGYPESRDYEEVLKGEARNLYRYVREITPDPAWIVLFQHENDCHNFKVLLKEEFSCAGDGKNLVENSIHTPDRIRDMIGNRAFPEYPATLQRGILESAELFSKTRDPQMIDIVIDNAYSTYFYQETASSRIPFLKQYADMIIDTGNIKAFFRIKKSMEDLDLLMRVLVDAGSIRHQEYVELFDQPLEAFQERLRHSPYSALAEFGEAAVLEKECENLVMGFLRKTRYKVFGLEPIVGYLHGKLTEIRNVRIIIVGNINGLDSESVRECLRLGYV